MTDKTPEEIAREILIRHLERTKPSATYSALRNYGQELIDDIAAALAHPPVPREPTEEMVKAGV